MTFGRGRAWPNGEPSGAYGDFGIDLYLPLGPAAPKGGESASSNDEMDCAGTDRLT